MRGKYANNSMEFVQSKDFLRLNKSPYLEVQNADLLIFYFDRILTFFLNSILFVIFTHHFTY